MCVALMQEYRLAQLYRQVELSPEGNELRRAGRKIAEIIQATFADCHDLRRCGERGELLQRRLVELGRVMRMNTGRAAKALRVGAHQLDRRARARERTASDQHVH